jgi:ATP-dependent Lon protease
MTRFLPILPLRDIVVFPHRIVPLFVGREKSVAALEAAMAADKELFLVAQLDPGEDDPDRDALYDLGVIATAMQLLKLPDGTVRVLVEGVKRARLVNLVARDGFAAAEVEEVEEEDSDGPEAQALMRSVIDQFENYAKLNKRLPAETGIQLSEIENASVLADAVASNLSIKVADKQALLGELNPARRLEMVFAFMEGELGVLQVEKKIRSRVKRQMEKTQREYYLNEQLKAIQRELGNEGEEGGDELAELAEKIRKTRLSKEARARANSELKKLRAMAPMSAEATVARNYLDVLLGLPWGKKSKLKKDIAEAQRVLDEDHYGLEKVKERIVEYLAVQARTNKLKGPILCLVGPPGVGKTSLGRSIARATGREFVRQSLGGVRDEAEIRGHRRTYIGSLPGKIISNIKKAGTSNPLFLLDEIDKLGQDFRGDPSSALLEVLDPEQNSRFQDHYLELDYDLSDVMFVTTANSLDMPQPLMDRMEIIRLEGYTEDEKVEIAKRHLIPKQMEAHGLKDGELEFTDEALRAMLRFYTREAGVRTLEREPLSKAASCGSSRRARRAPGRKEDPQPRQAPDGEDAARILFERAIEGDPARAGQRRRRGRRRARRARREDPQDAAFERGSGSREFGAEEAPCDGADVGRSHRSPELSRRPARPAVGQEVEAQEGHRRGAEGPRRGPLWARESERADRRISRGPGADE